MHTIEIPDNKKTISIPEHWDECTPDQLAMILQRAYQVSSGIIDMNTFYIIVFAKLTGLKAGSRYHFLRRLAPRKFSDINATIFQLAQQLCSWPFAQAPQLDPDEPPRMELNYDTVKNLLTPIKAGGVTFYGPADLLSDITFAEFRAALREMDAHIEAAKDPEATTEALEYLNRFMAILYRPAKEKPGQRAAYNPDDLHTYTHLAKAIPLWQKNTALLWFTYCIKFIQTEDINIDGQIINLAVLFPKSTGGTGTAKKGIGWAGLLFDVAKDGPFGDAEKTDRIGLFDILLYMYKNHHDNKEMERKLKTKKK